MADGFTVSLPDATLLLGARTCVMGILNVTPDSFSDGGLHATTRAAIRYGRKLWRDGAHIIDVGGESTRPGAPPVAAREECRRVIPVVETLSNEGILISIDTTKSTVARAAFRAGARILNDVSALGHDRSMARLAARAGVGVILMHRRGTPRTMQKSARYRDVVAEISRELRTAVSRALSAGIARDKIILDPGIGFGKTAGHNLEILKRLGSFRRLGFPLAIGTSRKSFIGHWLGRPVQDRLPGTAATVSVAILRGAQIVRVHDVREIADVARMTDLLQCSEKSSGRDRSSRSCSSPSRST